MIYTKPVLLSCILLMQANLLAGDIAKPLSTTTNVAGWQLSLALNTNSFAVSSPVLVTLQLSNMTNVRAEIAELEYVSDGTSAIAKPGFGKFLVTKTNSTESLPLRYLRSDGMVIANSRGGSVGPGQEIRTTYDLQTLFNLPTNGVYHVSFVGKVPAVTGSGGDTVFHTQPLSFEVHPDTLVNGTSQP